MSGQLNKKYLPEPRSSFDLKFLRMVRQAINALRNGRIEAADQSEIIYTDSNTVWRVPGASGSAIERFRITNLAFNDIDGTEPADYFFAEPWDGNAATGPEVKILKQFSFRPSRSVILEEGASVNLSWIDARLPVQDGNYLIASWRNVSTLTEKMWRVKPYYAVYTDMGNGASGPHDFNRGGLILAAKATTKWALDQGFDWEELTPARDFIDVSKRSGTDPTNIDGPAVVPAASFWDNPYLLH